MVGLTTFTNTSCSFYGNGLYFLSNAHHHPNDDVRNDTKSESSLVFAVVILRLNAEEGKSGSRIIAEDPEWNLETVPPLVEACITHITNNFHGNCDHRVN